MSDLSTASILTLQSHLQKSFRLWFKYYKNNDYHNKSLDPLEHELLFFASFTNVFSDSFKQEIHLASLAIFKSEKSLSSWVPFCNHIFIKVLDWTVNGIDFKANGKKEEKIFYRFIAMTYSQNHSIKNYSQNLLYCLLSKSNWHNHNVRNGVLLTCRYNFSSSLFSLDYVLALLSFLDVTKKMRGLYLIMTVFFVDKKLSDLAVFNGGKSIYAYKFNNPFYAYYINIRSAAIKQYGKVTDASAKRTGVQLNFDAVISNQKFVFLKETIRVERQINCLKFFISDVDLQKIVNAKEPESVSVGEPYKFVDPPSSALERYRE